MIYQIISTVTQICMLSNERPSLSSGFGYFTVFILFIFDAESKFQMRSFLASWKHRHHLILNSLLVTRQITIFHQGVRLGRN